ncbi:hypothetical protein D3C79_1026360 [compost metagenome]
MPIASPSLAVLVTPITATYETISEPMIRIPLLKKPNIVARIFALASTVLGSVPLTNASMTGPNIRPSILTDWSVQALGSLHGENGI